MKFLIDAQLPPALCGWLRDRGHEAVHVSEIGMGSASDAVIAALRGGWLSGLVTDETCARAALDAKAA